MPFAAHSCEGTEYDVVAGEETGAAAAFRPADPDVADYVVLEFAVFNWHEECEPVVSHPHDPFHRIDVLRSRRHVRVEHEGRVLAESSRPLLLFETNLPMRCYLPPGDVGELGPSDTVTYCAYKGRATYFGARRPARRRLDLPRTPARRRPGARPRLLLRRTRRRDRRRGHGRTASHPVE